MAKKDKYTQQDIAAKSRQELIDLKGQLADAYLNDDPNVSFDAMMETNSLIDREFDRRADEGNIG